MSNAWAGIDNLPYWTFFGFSLSYLYQQTTYCIETFGQEPDSKSTGLHFRGNKDHFYSETVYNYLKRDSHVCL